MRLRAAVVMLLITLIIKLDSPGPAFYFGQRVGEDGKLFWMLKFRTMVRGAEEEEESLAVRSPTSGTGPPIFDKRPDDPRVTRTGRFLRKTSLDELPQLWSILVGHMSLVGPRPERPSIVGQLTRELPLYRARHAVKPGVSGWAQIRYRYGNSVEDARKKLEYDLYYVKHASLYLDLMIVLQTARVVLRLRGQ